MSGRLRFGFVLVGACFGLACGHDAQLRRERLASPDCQRAGADPETCGGLGAAKAQRESGPGAGDVALEVLAGTARGLAESAPPPSSGCRSNVACSGDEVCVIPRGATSGTCAALR